MPYGIIILLCITLVVSHSKVTLNKLEQICYHKHIILYMMENTTITKLMEKSKGLEPNKIYISGQPVLTAKYAHTVLLAYM